MNNEKNRLALAEYLGKYVSGDDTAIKSRKDWLRLVASRILDDVGAA